MSYQRSRIIISLILSACLVTQVGCSREPKEDEPIVRWWQEGLAGLAYLGSKILTLYSRNVLDTYAEFPENLHCTDAMEANRTVDGTCNDRVKNQMGSQGVRFGRRPMPSDR